MLDTILGGRYRLVERIGEGGMAIVYRAEDTLLGRPVALKILRDEYAADAQFLARFRSEAQAAAALSHPNIVNIYDVGEDAGRHYIVMEYVAGPTLKQVVQQRGALPLAQALELTAQICAAADAAHRNGIVHRDLKPQNVLVNGDGLAKVADFGLAQPVTAPAAPDAATVLGTAHYLSPEQAQGQPATPASDIYAIGVTLYELLTGRLPFDGLTAEEVALKQIQQVPTPPSELNDRLPPAVDGFVAKAMAKDPAQRYASAREMGSALQAYRQLGEGRTIPFQPQPGTAVPAATGTVPSARLPHPASAPATFLPPRSVAAQPVQVAPAASEGVDWTLALLLLVTLACIAGLVPLGLTVRAAFTPPAPTPLPDVSVPNLVGLPYADAEARLQALGLALVNEGERFDEKVPAGRIVAQTVPSSSIVKWGDPVGVVVSKGPELIQVPGVTGLPLADAQSRLMAVGLAVGRQESRSPTVPAGLVISQTPPEATALPRGATVTVTVSIGNKVLLPDLMGKPEAEAQDTIRGLGLNTTYVNYQRPEDVPPSERWRLARVPPGCVLSQTPPAGSLLEVGTTVYLAVRKP
jgi:serine/threonine-protein kinase